MNVYICENHGIHKTWIGTGPAFSGKCLLCENLELRTQLDSLRNSLREANGKPLPSITPAEVEAAALEPLAVGLPWILIGARK